jgi:hypothetical protein
MDAAADKTKLRPRRRSPPSGRPAATARDHLLDRPVVTVGESDHYRHHSLSSEIASWPPLRFCRLRLGRRRVAAHPRPVAAAAAVVIRDRLAGGFYTVHLGLGLALAQAGDLLDASVNIMGSLGAGLVAAAAGLPLACLALR